MNEKNENCFLAILELTKTKLKTEEVINLTDNFPELCSGCKSGNDVILAGMKLAKKGLVKREVGKGGYYWSLVNQS